MQNPNQEPLFQSSSLIDHLTYSWLILQQLPSTLCIHIQRTSWTAYGAIKRNDRVLFPDYLDMSSYTNSQPRISNLLPVFSLVKDGGKLTIGETDCIPKLQ